MRIFREGNLITLINVFETKLEQQQELIDQWIRLAEKVKQEPGLPKAALTDRMKSVFLDMDGKTPIWNPLFADFMASLGVSPRVCRPFKPQTKGKVERSVGVIKNGFWPGVHFSDIDHLNGQAKLWCDRLNRDPSIARRAKCL